ncbi:hypothetical protein OG474_03015 [Kribbella sp. NBC_01505]|uniref:hypothetical protein n=1 Tax=Kribbella sp. NBC_01505 TaxID=2903580 RepID=UPI003866286B
MLDIDFVVAEMTASSGWARFSSAKDFVQAWRSFVRECRDGYSMSIYEYENDLSVRTEIQLLLDDERMRRTVAFREFNADIEEIDGEFSRLLQDGLEIGDSDAPWWKRGVLKEAGEELVGDFMNMFGVHIRTIEAS